ncbi:Ribosomal large subunit pseudouridine synthase C [Arsenophonus endosymbiont of Aleurodicus dispersus]|uniref:23S rRNA pseudouridine(955/2504/2580) synthase RluC n=1 Tax=Arsenophonus endosymbiont of Aleurodicus dispersus TaxID=235559 RepID=UPI000EB58061|nr:23S rRNA pseudouridine(955/2504/2580) synthase RluC [Arsenophonus endosymbiont of Aleurodicus dispersus]VAY02462.1 Ribosomal large subunit pseudouridine synthase C [Arsenophonus endosymbiont of Aleurodicus dispersus]
MIIHNQVQFVTINNDQAGQRIDNFLFTRLKGIPKSRIYRLIRKGEVRINNGRINPEYKVQAGDFIRIPPVRLAKKQKNVISAKLGKVAILTDYILYEDQYLLVLNKPSGMAVHGGSGVNFGVIEALRALHPEAHFLELVHRLDLETSGVLLIAKKRSALRALHQQLSQKKIQKQYVALVKGQWPSHIKVIQVPLLKVISQNGERIVKVNSNGKYSETYFQIKERISNATLVNAFPITGRTHQIRVHAQYAKHPIAYDNRYGDPNFDKELTFTGLKRLFLHASSLIFIHPVTGEKLTFNAPLDQQLKICLALLRKE